MMPGRAFRRPAFHPGIGTGPELAYTVTAKSDTKLTLRIEQTVGGRKGPPTEQVIDLEGPYPPVKQKDPKDETKTVIGKLGAGKGTPAIGGKTYDCDWAKAGTTITIKGGMTLESVSTVWHCKDVPLGWAGRCGPRAWWTGRRT
jgi:hypothetical protein